MDTRRAATALEWTLPRLDNPVLWGGTLLGRIRENRILPWDQDVDIALDADRYSGLAAYEYRRARWEPWMILHTGREYPHGNVGYRICGVKVGLHLLMGDGDWRYYTRHPGELVKVPDPYPNDGDLPADPSRILDWLYGDWERTRKKYIRSPAHVANQQRWLVTRPATVYTDGVFDLFHHGHEQLLIRAHGYGAKLIVGVKTDDATERMKGRRPVNPLKTRMRDAAIYADEVVAYDTSTLEHVKPSVFVHGDDWETRDRSRIRAQAERYGTTIVLVPRTPHVSTSLLRR